MEMFRNSTIDYLYYDDDNSYEGDPCEVRIENGEIIIDYEEDGKRLMYRGTEKEPGHFELINIEMDGRASLHRFKGCKILEGSWIEGGNRGMWKIHLA